MQWFLVHFWNHFAIMFQVILWTIVQWFVGWYFVVFYNFHSNWDSPLASFRYPFRYFLEPAPQGCLWRFLGSFWIPFGSILIVSNIFLLGSGIEHHLFRHPNLQRTIMIFVFCSDTACCMDLGEVWHCFWLHVGFRSSIFSIVVRHCFLYLFLKAF